MGGPPAVRGPEPPSLYRPAARMNGSLRGGPEGSQSRLTFEVRVPPVVPAESQLSVARGHPMSPCSSYGTGGVTQRQPGGVQRVKCLSINPR
jgi:hypothetical protein